MEHIDAYQAVFALIWVCRILSSVFIPLRFLAFQGKGDFRIFGLTQFQVALGLGGFFAFFLTITAVKELTSTELQRYFRSAFAGETSIVPFSRTYGFMVVVVDLFVFSAFYTLSLEPGSDLFLFLLLPVLSGLMYRPAEPVTMPIVASIFFLAASYGIFFLRLKLGRPLEDDYKHWPFLTALALRWGFLFGFGLSLTSLVQSVRYGRTLYASLLNQLPVVIWRKDRAGRFTHVNEIFLKVTARTVGEVVGRTDDELFGPLDKACVPRFKQGDRQVMETGEMQVFPQEPFPLPGGERILNQVIKAPTYNALGRLNGTQGCFIDSTREAKKLAQAQLMQGLAIAAQRISHDVQNKRTNIEANLRAAKRKVKEMELSAVQPFLDHLDGECDHLFRLLERFAGYDRLQKTATNLKSLIEQRVQRFETEHRIKCDVRPDSNCSYDVEIDSLRVIDSVDNLLLNALEALRKSPPADAETPKIRIRLYSTPGWIHLSCANQGKFKEETLKKINNDVRVSEKTDPERHGLGIPSIKACMDQHNGIVKIENDKDKAMAVVTLSFRPRTESQN